MMCRHLRLLLMFPVLSNAGTTATAGDWPWWRRPERDGRAGASQSPPLKADDPKLIRWVSPVPGRGHGSVSVVGGRLLLQTADEDAETQSVICFDRVTGKKLWMTEVHQGGFPKTNKKASHASTTPACDGKRVFVTFVSGGAAHITALTLDGEILWQKEIFTSGGYPKNHVAAFLGDGSWKKVWENISRVYVPSMLVREGYLYAVMDGGIAVCWKCDTGEQMWKERLGGNFSSSPVLVGDHIYVGNEMGEFFVYKADPREFEVVAKSKLGDEMFTTPTICDGKIFARVMVRGEGREKSSRLFCIGSEN